mgnify:CR=1 FL=1
MAIDPRISLTPAPTINVGQRFGQALRNVQGYDNLQQNRQLAPLKQQAAQMNIDMLSQQQAQANNPLNQALLNAEQEAKLDQFNAKALNTALATNNPQVVTEALNQQLKRAIEYNLPNDIAEAKQALQLVNQEGGLQVIQQATTAALTPTGSQVKSVGQKERQQALSVLESDPKQDTLAGKEAAIFLGLTPKASISASERIAQDKELARLIAENKKTEAEAAETGKSVAQLKFLPQIKKATKLAEKKATEEGEVLTDLARMEAALPGLNQAVSQLRALAPIATSTYSGKLFNFGAKELGFGATKGATAKAKFIGIINNQVLPLLKPTFGGSFSVEEGNSLKATMGDPDASPEEKLVQLDAFMEQKQRDVQTKQAQLGKSQQQETTQEGARATNPQTGQVAVFTNGEWVIQ